jgi:hypothetical protein
MDANQTVAEPDRIVFTRYWPAGRRRGVHVALGVERRAFYAGLGVPLACLVAVPWVMATGRPVYGLALALLAWVPNRWMVKSRRFYVVDAEGKPVRVVGATQPERVRGKRGMGRRRFLAAMASAKR